MFHGLENHLHGAYAMTRRFTGETVVPWTEIDFRTTAWFGSCPLVPAALVAAAQARGVIKKVEISVDAGTVSVAGEQVPGDRHSTSSATHSNIVRKFHGQHAVSSIWHQAASADFEIYVEFDIADP